MNKAAQFEECLKRAEAIVRKYRDEAPDGFDPQGTWVAIAVGVGGAAISAGSSMLNKPKSGGAGGGSLPAFKPPPMPSYVPLDIGATELASSAADTAAYKKSDTDFLLRHPEIAQAESLAGNRALQDQRGNTTLMPQIQSEFMRAGIGNALDSFGDLSGVLKMGSAGEADVARNLGNSITGFQQLNRGNATQSLSLAEAMFPRRQFGMTGQNVADLLGTQNLSQNNFNQANYNAQLGAYETQYGVNANNMAGMRNQANVNSAAGASMWGGVANGIGGLAKGFGQYSGMGGSGGGLMDNGFYGSANGAASAYGSGAQVGQFGGGWGLTGYG